MLRIHLTAPPPDSGKTSSGLCAGHYAKTLEPFEYA